MAANEPNRSTCRATLAAGLDTKCVDDTGSAQIVYAYQVDDFGGQTPTIVVTGASSAREQDVFGASNVTTFGYDVHVFVVYANGTAWTESDSEDRLDLLEKEVSDWIMDNRSGTLYWQYREQSAIEPLKIGGIEYRHEIIPVAVEVLI